MKRYCSRCNALHQADQRCPLKRNGSTRAWRNLRTQVLATNPACVDCGTTQQLHIDHRTPLAMGGTDHPSNLTIRCETCNKQKGATIA